MEKLSATVLSLFVTEAGSTGTVRKSRIEVDEKGIVGDKHYDRDRTRSILISATSSYAMAKEALACEMPHGYLGENLLIDENPYLLPLGTRLQAGTAILEITQNCTLCSHLSKLDKRIPKLLKDDRGIFAKVIEAGTIKEGDTITTILPAP